ncbi:MAG: hypothetical protein AB7I33_00825 [Gemmatimonadales bacterium]
MTRTRALILAVAASALIPRAATAQVGKSTLLDPNLATEQELAALPGMTPALAHSIAEQRPYLTMLPLDSLLAGSLTPEQRTDLYRRMWVHLNLNAATREEILLIPGVGNRMLREFMEYRPYAGLAVFHREIGKYVKDDELARLESYVYVPIDLNTASDEDILTIPGVGRRMLREFKEYRPYTGMEQFRREIGKYVDDKEVARLERYVTIR